MVPWYLHYNDKGEIREASPGEPMRNSKWPHFFIDQHSPLDQIDLLNKFRKSPVGIYVVENPITKVPKLTKKEKRNIHTIKPNLVEVLENNCADVVLEILPNKLSVHTNFELKGYINLFVCEQDPSIPYKTIKIDKSQCSFNGLFDNKRFFVLPYDKTFGFKKNKYSTGEFS